MGLLSDCLGVKARLLRDEHPFGAEGGGVTDLTVAGLRQIWEQTYGDTVFDIEIGAKSTGDDDFLHFFRCGVTNLQQDGQPGDQLPSEAQLCRRYGISPMTVRRSINLLADQDVINTAQGKGTFVKPLEWSTAQFDLRELQNLFQNSADTEIKLLDVRIVAADERTARKLCLPEGSNTIYIRRLISQGGQPLFYHRAYLIYDPKRPIVEAEMDVTSLQGLFANGDNVLMKRGQLTIDATLMNEEEANALEVNTPAAAFFLEHIFYDFDDQPISWGWFIFPSTFVRFTTQIGVDAPK